MMELLVRAEAAMRKRFAKPYKKLRVKGRVAFIGDTHGDTTAASYVRRHIGDFGGAVFLGDYVDRGGHSVDNLCSILSLFLENDSVIALRGNHEDVSINAVYGFLDEIEERIDAEGAKNISIETVKKALTALYSSMPVAADVNGYFCAHGGIPESGSIEDIEAQGRVDEVAKNRLVMQLLWNDPNTDISGFAGSDRDGYAGTVKRFGNDAALEFVQRNGLRGIIRGHEVIEDGIRRTRIGSGAEIITVFSTGGNGAYLGLVPHPSILVLDGDTLAGIDLAGEKP